MLAPQLERLVGVAVGVTLSTVLSMVPVHTAAAFAGEGDVTPESANTARFEIEQQGQQMITSGAHADAAELYWREGVRLKDPILIVDSAEALEAQAKAERSIEPAKAAIERVAPALDMLYFLRDGATSSAWQPIAAENLDTAVARAEAVITDANALIAEIEEEQRKAAEAAAEPEPEPNEKRSAKPGTGLLAAGSALLVIGLGGGGLGVAGLVLGAQAQADVEDPLVYEPEHDQAASRGQTANVLAGVGFAVAGVGVGAGIALIVVGQKKRKQAGDPGLAAEASIYPIWLGDGGGLGVVGRF